MNKEFEEEVFKAALTGNFSWVVDKNDPEEVIEILIDHGYIKDDRVMKSFRMGFLEYQPGDGVLISSMGVFYRVPNRIV